MNWMTSGKHRALYSQRGRRRQMHFPSQVQRQRVKPTSPPRSSQPARARDSTTPWYIVSVGDDDESQDIRVLELERKGAMSSAEIEAERKADEAEPVCVGGGDGARPSSTQKRKRQQEQDAQDGESESRCIFTPVKKARKYDHPPIAVRSVKSVREERPPSSVASGVDMLFFNDGEELPHNNQARNSSRASSRPASSDLSRFSQRTSGHDDQAAPPDPPQSYFQNKDVHLRQAEAQQYSSEGGSIRSIDTFPDSTSDTGQQEYELWRANENALAGSSPDTAFSRPETPPFRNEVETSHDTLPLSPFAASPLSFRMSRADVIQSQFSNKNLVIGPAGAQLSLFGNPHGSPSPSTSTSTSSQGSIVLGHPPPGWQKKMLSLREERNDRLDQHFSSPPASPAPASPTLSFDSASANGDQPLYLHDHQLKSSLSTRSSPESDGENSIIGAVIPIDAKERIMAAATSQQLPEDSRVWFQRPATTSTGARHHYVVESELYSHLADGPVLNNIDSTGSIHSTKSMTLQQQSWTMSSRTKTILDAASASKAQNLVEKRDTKYQEMESVAIYMYTLVQCYKIDERLRTNTPRPSTPEHAQLTQEATSVSDDALVTKPAAPRREIVFSPKRN